MDTNRYFFKNGIRFECTRCGICCTGEPGTVYINKEEMYKIAKYLNIEVDVLKENYLYPFRDSYSIKELENGDCIFFKDGCSIYPVRPMQCRTYPFWMMNLRNEKRWEQVKKECPGIGNGRIYTADEIIEIINNSPI